MNDAEFRAFVAQARAEVDAELARLDALDWEAMEPDDRATMEELRRGDIELRCGRSAFQLLNRRAALLEEAVQQPSLLHRIRV